MEMTSNKVVTRLYNALVILFYATPFLFLIYGQLQQQVVGIDIREILEMNPYLNITFITSFVTPFIGLYLTYIKQEFEENSIKEEVLINLVAITISFLIMGNITYGLFVSILVYFIYLEWRIGVKGWFNYYRSKAFSIKDWIAPISVLLVGVLIRVMLVLVTNK